MTLPAPLAPLARLPPWLVDIGLAAVVAVAGVLPSGHEPRWAYPLAFVAGAALVLRRRYPRVVVLATYPALLGQLGTIAAGAALYALGRARPGYRPLVPWVAATMAVTLLLVAYKDIRYGAGPPTWADWVVTVLVTLLITGGPAAAGALASTRRELAASVDALRAAEADRDDAVVARVRADERGRIARDMHDIVGHYASLIAVQASALESSAPDEQTRRTARTIRELSSRALDEMRSAVTTWLDQPGGQPLTSDWTRWVLQPAVAAGESGVQVTVEITEVLPAEVDEPALRALHRVVQEGITNAIRHSPGAAVHVRLDTDGEMVRVEVHNAAPGAGPPAKGGRGLAGLVDRIGALGGTVDAGPDLFGKWVLRACVPAGHPTLGNGYVR